MNNVRVKILFYGSIACFAMGIVFAVIYLIDSKLLSLAKVFTFLGIGGAIFLITHRNNKFNNVIIVLSIFGLNI